MYERSASVLEKYFEKFFGLDKTVNLKRIYVNYKNIIEEIKKYQIVAKDEEELINEFDEIAKNIEEIQKTQAKIYNSNVKLEQERNNLFNELDIKPEKVEENFKKINEKLLSNNEEMNKLGNEYISILSKFADKQKDRNKATKTRRISENSYIETVKRLNNEIMQVDTDDVKKIKEFVQNDKESFKNDIITLMIENGKNERIGFNKKVIQEAVEERINIGQKEAECYLITYDRLKKLLTEIESDSIRITKYEKTLRDVTVKLAFLNVEKEYIAGFLDNERMTVINGQAKHNKLMEEACANFILDVNQINNLYELILKEIVNKGTKKLYKELYNKTYLKSIEEKEKNFEEEITSMKLSVGTVINSNYWRIEGIKNIYEIFQSEVSEKFDKDLSEYRLDEEIENEEISDNVNSKKSRKKLLITESEDKEDYSEINNSKETVENTSGKSNTKLKKTNKINIYDDDYYEDDYIDDFEEDDEEDDFIIDDDDEFNYNKKEKTKIDYEEDEEDDEIDYEEDEEDDEIDYEEDEEDDEIDYEEDEEDDEIDYEEDDEDDEIDYEEDEEDDEIDYEEDEEDDEIDYEDDEEDDEIDYGEDEEDYNKKENIYEEKSIFGKDIRKSSNKKEEKSKTKKDNKLLKKHDNSQNKTKKKQNKIMEDDDFEDWTTAVKKEIKKSAKKNFKDRGEKTGVLSNLFKASSKSNKKTKK